MSTSRSAFPNNLNEIGADILQGFGILGGSVVSLITVRAFKNKIMNESILYLDFCWRIVIGLGCLPAIATIYLRYALLLFTANALADTHICCILAEKM